MPLCPVGGADWLAWVIFQGSELVSLRTTWGTADPTDRKSFPLGWEAYLARAGQLRIRPLGPVRLQGVKAAFEVLGFTVHLTPADDSDNEREWVAESDEMGFKAGRCQDRGKGCGRSNGGRVERTSTPCYLRSCRVLRGDLGSVRQ